MFFLSLEYETKRNDLRILFQTILIIEAYPITLLRAGFFYFQYIDDATVYPIKDGKALLDNTHYMDTWKVSL